MQKDSRLGNIEALLPKPKAKKDLEKISRRKTNLARISQAETKEEKELVKQKIKLTQAKSNLTRATKNIKKLITEEKVSIDLIPDEVLEELELDQETNIIFKPNPGPQEEFLAASEDEVFYGGARGGGKTYVLIIDPLRECHNSNHRALFIRRTMPELRDIIHQTKMLYDKAYPGAKWKEQDKVWTFPSGARIEFGFAENIQDALRYQGQQYTWIGFDELPQYPDAEVYNFIKSSLRSIDPTLKECIRACVDYGNVLTENGWKDIKEVNIKDKVWSIDNKGFVQLKKVTNTFKYKVDEELIKYSLRGCDISITQDHKLICRKHNTKEYINEAYNKLFKGSFNLVRAGEFKFKGSYKGDTLNFSVKDYMAYLGLFLSEGCTTTRNRVTITQCKPEGKIKVDKFLTKLFPNIRKYKNGDFCLTNRWLHDKLKIYGKAKYKFVPREILNTASKEELQILFDWLIFGDGHRQSETSVEYYTTSKQLQLDVAEIAFKLGYCVRLRERDRPEYSKNMQYELSMTFRNNNIHKIEKRNSFKEQYKGYVYCISVEDNESFILEQNGFCYFSGNTGNPGNIGSAWVKEEFIDPAPENTTFYKEVKYLDPRINKMVTRKVSRKFIPAKVWDNPYLIHNDNYIATLASLPEAQRKQFLEGDWNTVKGAAFEEFDRPKGTHVIEPFDIPRSWYRFRAADWGYSSPFCCLWFAVDYDSNLYVYREYYGKGVIADTWARNVAAMEKQERIWYGVIDGSTNIKRGETGPSIYETINTEIKASGSVPFRFADRSPGSRAAGKQEVHKRLAIRPTGLVDKDGNDILKPSLFIFNTCVNLIRTLPMLPLDRLDPEKVEKKSEDHAYDALHYGLRSRPVNPAQILDVNRFREQNMPKTADSIFGY